MKEFVKKYIDLLNASDDHLNGEIISTYINFYNNLSIKEKNVVENHLTKCAECRKKFNEIFDEDFEFDEAQKLSFHQMQVGENQKKYEDEKGRSEILFERDNSQILLKFVQLPEDLQKQNFKINISAGSVLRIISAEVGKPYYFDGNMLFEELKEIEVYYLRIFGGKTEKTTFTFSKYYGYAAAAVIIVFLMIGYFYFSQPEKSTLTADKNKQTIDSSIAFQKPAVEPDTQKIKEDNNLIAQNRINPEDFKENIVLENFINRTTRSAGNIEIKSPAVNDTVKGKIELRWKSNLPAGNYHIIIVNNKNQKIWEITTKNNQTEVQKKLAPGIYYWKIVSNNEMKDLGKFIVR